MQNGANITANYALLKDYYAFFSDNSNPTTISLTIPFVTPPPPLSPTHTHYPQGGVAGLRWAFCFRIGPHGCEPDEKGQRVTAYCRAYGSHSIPPIPQTLLADTRR